MQYLRRDVTWYFERVMEERLRNDPNRLIAFRDLSIYFNNNRACPASERYAMISSVFGNENQELVHVCYSMVQEECEQALIRDPPEVRSARLRKIAKLCWCVQFLELYRQRFTLNATIYPILSNAVRRFATDQISEAQLCAHLSQVLLQFPDFRIQLEARVNRLTTLFRDGEVSGGPSSNNPPAGANPPPPPPKWPSYNPPRGANPPPPPPKWPSNNPIPGGANPFPPPQGPCNNPPGGANPFPPPPPPPPQV